MASKDLTAYRKNYQISSLGDKVVPDDPFNLFKIWFEQADQDTAIDEVNAMTLATADKLGRPRSRVVLLKEYDTSGFVFFTNYRSKKGKALTENPFACISFFWPSQERQIIIEGPVQQVSAEQSDTYFKSRPLGSQLGAIASEQSAVIAGRSVLENHLSQLIEKYSNSSPERPDHWGGYRLIPEAFEFWQGRENRLHDRISYIYENSAWRSVRLAP